MRRLSEILKQWKDESGSRGILQFKYLHSNGMLLLCTPYPGWFIGKYGALVDKYRNILKSEISEFTDIQFVETDSWYIR